MNTFWDERFGGEEYVYGTDPNEFLVSQVSHFTPKARVLSIGEGEGRNAVYLAKQGFHVTAVDSSIKGIEKAKKLATQLNVHIEFIHSELSLATFESGFDAVISIFCHLPRSVRTMIHRNAERVLVPNGIIVIEGYRPDQLKYETGGPKDLDLLITLNDLVHDFSHCRLEEGSEVERNVVEGKFHTGKAAVVQARFRKM